MATVRKAVTAVPENMFFSGELRAQQRATAAIISRRCYNEHDERHTHADTSTRPNVYGNSYGENVHRAPLCVLLTCEL